MKVKAKIIFVNLIPQSMIFGEWLFKVDAWRKEHQGDTIQAECLSDCSDIKCNYAKYGVRIDNCIIDVATLSPNEFLEIAGEPAYLGAIYPIEDTPAHTFAEFVQEIFMQGELTREEQAEILHMTVGEFCQLTDNPNAPVVDVHKLNISRAQLLSNPRDVFCPRCNMSSGITIVDGNIDCKLCGAHFGDIDDLKD